MEAAFEKLLKQGIEANCDLIQLDNESEGFEIYLISNNSGYPAELSSKEIGEIRTFLRKVKKKKGLFNYKLNDTEYKISVRFREDFGEQVFSLTIYK